MAAGRTIAVLGGTPAFVEPLHVAQVNLPSWDDVAAAFSGIFERHYFANHGPLVHRLDEAFAEATGTRHAVCVANGTVALMVLARALELSGEVIAPSFTFPATVQALEWAGLTPVLCDVEAETHMISPRTVEPVIGERTVGVMGVHAWGKPCDPDGLQTLCDRRGLALIFDACHGVGCTYQGRPLGNFGIGEAFSFHATKVMNGAEGGCITTNDDDFAARLRTIRSFHPGETFADVPTQMNAKMSEAQAALALLSLKDLDVNIRANIERYRGYAEGLEGLPGLSLLQYGQSERNNHQYVVLEVDPDAFGLDRDQLLAALEAENILCRRHFFPGVHRTLPQLRRGDELKNTERLCARLLQLPNGQIMTRDDVARVAEAIGDIHASRAELAARSRR